VQRVVWTAIAIVDHANRVRLDPSGLKVAGHRASSASLTTVMTALWFEHLRPGDRVSVKPHASPVLHAVNYLLGDLGERYLTTLRSFGGLQFYPSRSKDPDTVDYSTGSVGSGATAPIWGAMPRRPGRDDQLHDLGEHPVVTSAARVLAVGTAPPLCGEQG
jgi:pyruvate dehydrogenase E1 component